MTKKVALVDVYGMGGWRLDPAGGQAVIVRRVRDLGVTTLGPFDPSDAAVIGAARKAYAAGAIMTYCADSCGANRFSWLQSQAPEIKWRYAALIQPSTYCNAGCPPIGFSAKEVDVFYAPFLTWPLPGLGCYKPQPLNTMPDVPPSAKITYPGTYTVNSGQTRICYLSVQTHVHPGDDIAGVQAVIVSKIKTVVAEASAA